MIKSTAPWYAYTTTDPRGSIALWVVFSAGKLAPAEAYVDGDLRDVVVVHPWTRPWDAIVAVFSTEAEAQAYVADALDPALEIYETATGIPPRGEGREVLPFT